MLLRVSEQQQELAPIVAAGLRPRQQLASPSVGDDAFRLACEASSFVRTGRRPLPHFEGPTVWPRPRTETSIAQSERRCRWPTGSRPGAGAGMASSESTT